LRTKDLVHRHAVHGIASRRRNPVLRGIARAAHSYLGLYDNVSYDARLNGERRVLAAIAALAPAHLFDVGANVGNWALEAAALAPAARIHAFEIVPDTAAELARRTAALGRVEANAFGLGAREETVEVTHYPAFSEGSGVGGLEHELPSMQIQCRVRAADDYCAEHGIDRVALLKIDTEGMEGAVLAGCERLLAEQRIDAIQFEYGRANIVTRTLLGDLYAVLEASGFVVGKVFPNAVQFRAYDLLDEDFRGANFVAVDSRHDALIARLRGR
jgi:FkbM family methyltransferase